MVSLGGYPTKLTAFRCSGPFQCQICESKTEKLFKVVHRGQNSPFKKNIFTMNTYFIIAFRCSRFFAGSYFLSEDFVRKSGFCEFWLSPPPPPHFHPYIKKNWPIKHLKNNYVSWIPTQSDHMWSIKCSEWIVWSQMRILLHFELNGL